MSFLLDNQSPADPPSTFSSGGTNTYANCFTVDGFVTPSALRYYATQAGANGRPNVAVLYRMSDSTVVRTWSSIPNPSGAGWTDYTPGDMPELAPGIEYRLAWRNISGTQMPYWATDPTVAPPAPFAWAGDASLQNAGSSLPATAWTGAVGIGFVAGASSPNPAPPGSGASNPAPAVAGDLNWWLNKATTNPDSAPKLTYDLVAGADLDALSSISTILAAVGSRAAGASKTGATAMMILMWLVEHADEVTAALGNLADTIGTLLGWTEDQGAPTALILDRLAYLQESVGLDMARRNEAITPEVWTLVDTLEWEGPFTWDVPADRYRLHVETVGPFRPVNVVAGLDVLYKSGWWSLLTDTVAGERRWLSFRDQDLWVPGARAPGILVHPWPEATGTLQAWQRNAPTP